MDQFLPFIITGVLTGTIYGLAASGLVLTFKTSGIFNFGHGAILTAGALVFYWLRVTLGWDWKPAFFVSVFVCGPLFGLLMELVARGLSRQRSSMKIVGTVGLTVLIPSICLIAYPRSQEGLRVERYLPFSNRQRYRVNVFDVNVFGDQIVVGSVALVAVASLYLLFRYTRLGAAMRAVVDDADLLDLQGTDPVRVRRISWMIGCTFACLSGVLIVPLVGLQPYALTFLATYAFGAAALGGFASIPITMAGGLFVGITEDVAGFLIRKYSWNSLSGLPEAMPFLLLFVVLLLMPKGRLRAKVGSEQRPPLQWSGPAELRLVVGVVVVALLAIVPHVVGGKLTYFTLGLCQAVLVLSLGLLVRNSGQTSLCHAAFAAIGAVTFSQLVIDVGLPWFIAAGLACLVVVPVGALIALPAIRLQGVYLALATFGFGILVQRLFFPQTWMFATFAGSRRAPQPPGIATDTGWYYAVLLVVVVVALATTLVTQSRLGRVLEGMSDAPVAVSTLGLSTSITKLIVFCLSALLAGLAGVLYAVSYGSIDGSIAVFQPFNSLVLVAVLALAPFRVPWYAIFAGVASVLPAYLPGDGANHHLNALFGLFAIMVAVQGGQPAMAPRLREVFGRFTRRRAADDRARPVEVALDRRPPELDRPGLEVDELTVSYGGLRAVNGLSLAAPIGRITGLIGPNGAGKTTTFDAVSGLNTNFRGAISFRGSDISKLAPPARGRLGLGRTFQRVELGDTLTVFDNVALGREAAQTGASVRGHLLAPRSDTTTRLAAAHDALALCGISHLASVQAGALSTGERRLVELARCLAGDFDLLLLDEPSSGLDRDETKRFGELLRRVVDERGYGVLLVEHDMSLVMGVCDYIYVLDFGQLIFEGSPDEVIGSPAVRAAYLGEESAELQHAEAEAV